MVRVAVLSDSSLQRHVLQQALSGQGYQIVMNTDPERILVADVQACEADVWLVTVSQANDTECPILDYLYETAIPVLFGEEEAPERSSEDYARWERSLFSKLDKLMLHPTGQAVVSAVSQSEVSRLVAPESLEPMMHQNQPAKEVWLLAASLGGPAAVKEFLDTLPGGLPIGFLYAQHIDSAFEENLPQAVGRHSDWHVRLAKHHDVIRGGEVVIVPIQNELDFFPNGQLRVLTTPWAGEYSPCINQVIVNLTRCFGARSGIIVFSGMGSDGAESCEYAHAQGAKIWIQSGQSCACASMPDSVRKTGLISYNSTPRGLAMAMLNHLITGYATDAVRITNV